MDGKSGSFTGNLGIDEVIFDLADDIEYHRINHSAFDGIDHQDQQESRKTSL
jgi:hypothetical protein